MKMRMKNSLVTILTVACVAAPSFAADDESVRKDLFTVITLQGMPCVEVVSFTTKNDNDHVAVCKDGNRYHVFVNAQGRVVVEKQ
jgi:hypothetical protein